MLSSLLVTFVHATNPSIEVPLVRMLRYVQIKSVVGVRVD